MDEKIVAITMEIIMNAGDARTYIQKAFAEAGKKNLEKAKSYLIEAEKKINDAHIAQTDIIQKAVRGEEVEVNLLLIHAQDTVMTINSEYIMAEQILTLLETLMNTAAQEECK